MNFDILFSFIGALAFAIFTGPKLIPLLTRLKFGQSIREEGPSHHQVKAGTPTMGGLLIVASSVFAVIITRSFSMETLIIMTGFILFGLVGFLDDFIKVVLKRNLGLRAYQKVMGQLVAGLATVIMGYFYAPDMILPFTGAHINIGLAFIPVMVLFFIFASNAVNLTDGLDGLASGTTVIAALFLGFSAIKLGNAGAAIFSFGLAGACLGFLYFNKYPAKVFMGDTGSLAIGGALCSIAMVLGLELFTPVFGLVFLGEALSVMIQVASFKTTGKRVFKMSPLHHHFELSGWKETKVVRVFWTVAAAAAAASWLMLR